VDRRQIEQLWNACGATKPLKVWSEVRPETETPVDQGPAEGAQELGLPLAVIGRDPKADCQLDHDAISKHHVAVLVIGGRPFWFDMGSRTGVAQDDVWLTSGWLDPGAAIEVGPFWVRAEVGGTLTAGPMNRSNPTTDRAPSSWPEIALAFPNRPGGPDHWRLSRVLTLVGRASDCRLRIPDEAISRFHCALLRTPSGLWVIDLLSREGVRVNGSRVRAAQVEDGMTLHVGRYRMIARSVVPGSSSDSPPSFQIDPLPDDQLPTVAAPRRPPARSEASVFVEPGAPSANLANLEPFINRFEQMQQQMFEQFHQAMMTMFQTFGAMHRDQMDQVRGELERIRELSSELQDLQTKAERPPTTNTEASATPPQAEPSPSEPAGHRAPDRSPEPPSSSSSASKPSAKANSSPGPEIHDQITQRIAKLQNERQSRWKRVLALVSGGPGS